MKKRVPKFNSEKEEASFWKEHDSTEYIDWEKSEIGQFPNLKPATKSISIRLSESMLNQVKIIANKGDIPYQSLIKMFIQQGINKEL